MTTVLPNEFGRRAFMANASWAVIGNFGSSLLQWMVLSIIAKFGGTLELGQYALCLAWIVPVLILSALQLRSVQATDASEQYSLGDYFTLRCVTGVFALFLIGGIALLIRHFDLLTLLMILFGSARSIDGLSDVFYGNLQKHFRLNIVTRSLLIKGVANCIAVALALYYFRSLIVCALAMIVISFSVVFLHDYPAVRKFSKDHGDHGGCGPLLTTARLRNLFRLTYPLGISSGINAFRANISRYIIEYAIGMRAVGIFSAVIYPNFGFLTASGAVGQAISPRYGSHISNGRHAAFRSIVLQVVGVALLASLSISCACFIFAPQVLRIAYNPELATYSNVFRVILFALPFSCVASFLNDAMVARRRMHQQVYIFLGVALVEGTLALTLISRYGLLGVAIASVAAAMTHASLALYFALEGFDAVAE